MGLSLIRWKRSPGRARAVVVELAAQPAGGVVAELPADVEERRIAVERFSVIQVKATEVAAFVAISLR